MTPELLAAGLMKPVVEEGAATYRRLFADTHPDKASDPYWKRALVLFGQLSPAQRLVFFEILQQVSIDTVSGVLGVIDGSSYLANRTEDLVLTTAEGRKLSGDLQDLFLAQAEEQRSAS